MFNSRSIFTLLVIIRTLAVYSTETVLIDDGARLKKYLCTSNGTLPPNTNLVIKSSVNLPINEGEFCMIENTTNISITASQELLKSGELYVTVTCESDTGFGFFNVSHLTIRSVYFKNCSNVIPEAAVRYVNGTEQFLYYDDVRTSLIFNHCCNMTLYNVLVDEHPDINFGIIGVNLHGWSNINTVIPDNQPKSSILVYYTDSIITSTFAMAGYVNIETNLLSAYADGYPYDSLHNERISISDTDPNLYLASLCIIMTQQHFDINMHGYTYITIISIRREKYLYKCHSILYKQPN